MYFDVELLAIDDYYWLCYWRLNVLTPKLLLSISKRFGTESNQDFNRRDIRLQAWR